MSALIGLLIFATIIVVGIAIANSITSSDRLPRKQRKSIERQVVVLKRQQAAAEKALRNIAGNTSGNPALEAQLALDEINEFEIKELES